MEDTKYVHGYSQKEASRLNDQANALDNLLHCDSLFPSETLILEAGCGVGAQTRIIAAKNPDSHFISVDISEPSLQMAKQMVYALGIDNVQFQQADIFKLSFPDSTFDHVFICFVLEHLSQPSLALAELKRVLKPGGTMMVIEGDHGSAYFHPDSKEAHQTIDCLVELQKKHGGNANIGRELYPLMSQAGLAGVEVSPRMVYVDASRPDLVQGFIRDTFTAMVDGVEEDAVSEGLMDRDAFQKGIADLYRTAEYDGVFCYTFFKAVGVKV